MRAMTALPFYVLHVNLAGNRDLFCLFSFLARTVEDTQVELIAVAHVHYASWNVSRPIGAGRVLIGLVSGHAFVNLLGFGIVNNIGQS